MNAPDGSSEQDREDLPPGLLEHFDSTLLHGGYDEDLMELLRPVDNGPITELEEEPPWIAEFLAQYRLVFGHTNKVAPGIMDRLTPARTGVEQSGSPPPAAIPPVTAAEEDAWRSRTEIPPHEAAEQVAGSRESEQPRSGRSDRATGLLIAVLVALVLILIGLLMRSRYQPSGHAGTVAPAITTQLVTGKSKPQAKVATDQPTGQASSGEPPDPVSSQLSRPGAGEAHDLGSSQSTISTTAVEHSYATGDSHVPGLSAAHSSLAVKAVVLQSDIVNVGSRSASLPTPIVPSLQGSAQGLPLHKVQPVYPIEALAQRLEGRVALQVDIARDGTVTTVKVIRGNPVLARAAVEAVRQWVYPPYQLDGYQGRRQQITISFKAP
jgi:TonB family protein